MMDTVIHRHDLVHAMQKIRIILAMSLVIWIHFSLGYAIVQLAHFEENLIG